MSIYVYFIVKVRSRRNGHSLKDLPLAETLDSAKYVEGNIAHNSLECEYHTLLIIKPF